MLSTSLATSWSRIRAIADEWQSSYIMQSGEKNKPFETMFHSSTGNELSSRESIWDKSNDAEWNDGSVLEKRIQRGFFHPAMYIEMWTCMFSCDRGALLLSIAKKSMLPLLLFRGVDEIWEAIYNKSWIESSVVRPLKSSLETSYFENIPSWMIGTSNHRKRLDFIIVKRVIH